MKPDGIHALGGEEILWNKATWNYLMFFFLLVLLFWVVYFWDKAKCSLLEAQKKFVYTI